MESGWNHHRVSVRLMSSLLSARLSAPAWGHSALEWSVVCFQLLPVGTELNLTTTSSSKPSALSSRFSYPVVFPWFPSRVRRWLPHMPSVVWHFFGESRIPVLGLSLGDRVCSHLLVSALNAVYR